MRACFLRTQSYALKMIAWLISTVLKRFVHSARFANVHQPNRSDQCIFHCLISHPILRYKFELKDKFIPAMNKIIDLDSKDIQILNILQSDSTSSVQSIANRIGLTNNPCWRRIKRLQETGVILAYSVELNRHIIGLGTTAFVTLRIDNHNSHWLEQFSQSVTNMPEIIECHRMTGDVDYLLKIAVTDLNHYDQVYRRLIQEVPGLVDVSSTFSMEEIKVRAPLDASTSQQR